MADRCHLVGCDSVGTKRCSACEVASYCSVSCQREDWKVHKRSCVNISKLPTTLLPLSELNKSMAKMYDLQDILESQGRVKEAITLLERYLEFLEHQYGVQVEGSSHYRRSNGDLCDNVPLIAIRIMIATKYNSIENADAALAHGKKTRQMLEHNDRSNDSTLLSLCSTERIVADAYRIRQQLDAAEYHCEQSLMFARLIKGEGRITEEYRSLLMFSDLRRFQSRYPEAIDFAEQAYILVSGTYGPVHPAVQGAASQLIQHLIANGDYSRADDYCRMNYENLTDPRNGVDQKGSAVADGMSQIAYIWLSKPPVDDEDAAFALA